MFKKRKGGLEPPTPKIRSVALPDIYSPASSPECEKPRRGSFMRRLFLDRRSATPSTPSPIWQPPSSNNTVYSKQPPTRTRTTSMPHYIPRVEAPRPIRPHPSQGPPLPVLEGGPRIRTESSSSYRGPVGVPSAAYLEKHVQSTTMDTRRNSKIMAPKSILKRESYQKSVTPPDSDPKLIQTVSAPITAVSKAWVEAQGDNHKDSRALKLGPSYEKFEPVPIQHKDSSNCHDLIGKEWDKSKDPPMPLDKNGAPISVLKKVSSIRPPTVQPLMDPKLGWGPVEDRAAWSEDEATFNAKRNSRPSRQNSVTSNLRYDQRTDDERQRQRPSGRPSRGYSDSLVQTPRAAALPSRSSTSSGSPADNAFPQNHHRRATVSDPRSAASNYMPAYVKGQDSQRPPQPSPFAPVQHQAPRMAPSNSQSLYPSYPDHPPLSWPLIDYNARRYHTGYPMLYFDCGFDPKVERYQIKVKRGPVFGYINEEEKAMFVAPSSFIQRMVIVCRKLDRWPIIIERTNNVSVFDVFEEIYRTFSVPLTAEDVKHFGTENVKRCLKHFHRRCEDGPELTHLAERRGVLRVDLLKGKRIFKGLVPYPGHPGVWELQFDEGPQV